MHRMGLAEAAIFLHFDAFRSRFFVFAGHVISSLALIAGQRYSYSHHAHLLAPILHILILPIKRHYDRISHFSKAVKNYFVYIATA